MPQKDTQVKKITLIGICNGIAAQFTDEHGNLNVDVPIKIIETKQVNGLSVEEPDWVRVTARGNTAQKLAAVPKDSHVFIEGDARFDEVPNAQGIASFYIGVSAYRVVAVAAQETYINIVANGNLGRDPEMRYTPTGKSVTDFSIAVNDRREDDTTWMDVSCWDKLAEITNNHLNRGRSVLIDGRPSMNRWTAQDGQPRAKLQVTASTVEFLGGGQRTGNGGNAPAGNAPAPGSYAASSPSEGPADDMPW